jgi:hypothetical protein
MTEGNPPFGEIVRGELQRNFVARENADAIAAQPAGEVRQDYALVLQLHAKKPAGKFFKDSSSNFYAVFFAHKPRCLRTSPKRNSGRPANFTRPL